MRSIPYTTSLPSIPLITILNSGAPAGLQHLRHHSEFLTESHPLMHWGNEVGALNLVAVSTEQMDLFPYGTLLGGPPRTRLLSALRALGLNPPDGDVYYAHITFSPAGGGIARAVEHSQNLWAQDWLKRHIDALVNFDTQISHTRHKAKQLYEAAVKEA